MITRAVALQRFALRVRGPLQTDASRGVQHQRIYRIDSSRDYGPLAPLVARVDQTIDTELITEQWDRMGQL